MAGRGRLLGTAISLGLSACATSPPIVDEPPVELSLTQFAGTSLTGPQEEAPGPGSMLPLQVRWSYVERLPLAELEPLSAYADRIVAPGSPTPLGTIAGLSGEAFLHAGGVLWPEPLWERRQATALLPGSTAAFQARSVDPENGLRSVWHEASVEITRLPGGLEVAVRLTGDVLEQLPIPSDADADARPEEEWRQREELLHLNVAPRIGEPLQLALAAPTRRFLGGGLILTLERPALLSAVEADRARDELGRELDVTREEAVPLEPTERRDLWIRSVFAALAREPSRRSALSVFAERTGAPLAGDLALVASQEALASLADRVESARPSLGSDEPGWWLTHESWMWLTDRAEREDVPLEAELVSVLRRHAGAVARFPDIAREAVAESPGADELEERLVRENRTFLHDRNPTVRVRAFDWLSARREAPEGYDPLAPRSDRRAALARAEEQR